MFKADVIQVLRGAGKQAMQGEDVNQALQGVCVNQEMHGADVIHATYVANFKLAMQSADRNKTYAPIARHYEYPNVTQAMPKIEKTRRHAPRAESAGLLRVAE